VVTIGGNLGMGEKVKVDVKGGSKALASAMPLE
jgi:hypothetical protein